MTTSPIQFSITINSESGLDIEVESPSGYLIGDVDGDDVSQLNLKTTLKRNKTMDVDTEYTHTNANTYQQ